MWWRATQLQSCRLNVRRFLTGRRVEDEGDWSYSSEWWGNGSDGRTVFRGTSGKGNGVVSVIAYPSSKPSKGQWAGMLKWFQERYTAIHPDLCKADQHFKILGYQWRALRFNDDTRQSTVKVVAACSESDPSSVYLMQQAHCLAIPYVKSMVSAGLSTLASTNYDFGGAVLGKEAMKVLCIGHGGGSIPLFLASKIQGAIIDIVEIDPLVIAASIQEMGFPSYSVMSPSGKRARPKSHSFSEVMWKGIHERLHLYESDAENFILNTPNVYDIVFIDAYDGEDIFPRKLWDPHSPFLKALEKQVHPEHGTVVVNLHSDEDNDDVHRLPVGKYVSGVCKAYKDVLVGDGSGFAYTVAVPWVCNTSLVVCRSSIGSSVASNSNSDVVLETISSKSTEVEKFLNLPFSCWEYVRRGFALTD